MIRSAASLSASLPVLLVPLVLSLTGCPPPPNLLDGSIKSSHDLTFDRVELRYLSDQAVYQLSYFQSLSEEGGADAGADTVVKVTFNEPAGGVVVDTPIDITDPAIEGRVERITAADDPFPSELDTATVTFHSAATIGETVSGEFAVTFGNGRTLNGAFETELIEAAF